MRRQRLRAGLAMVGLLALALPFISAADTVEAVEGEGDATASLVGAALEVEDLDGLTAGVLGGLLGEVGGLAGLDTGIDLALLDGLTYATTRDEPDAWASVIPYRLGEDVVGETEAGAGERSTADAIDLTGVSALLSGVSVSPFTVSAEADEDGARALIDAVTASADVLGDGVLDLGLSEVVSEVTRVDALAAQDLVVDGLSLSLGDVLPEELLRLLPLDALLDLLEELDALGLLDGVDGLRDLLDELVGDARELIGELNGLDLSLLEQIDPALLEELLELRALLGELDALDAAVDDATGLLEGLLGALGAADAGATEDADEPEEGDEQVAAASDVGAQDLEDAEAELAGVLATLRALEADGVDLGAGCTADLGTTLTDLLGDADRLADCVADLAADVTGEIGDLVDAIAAQVDGLDDLLALVLDLLADLDDVLGELSDLLDEILGSVGEIAGIELLGAEEMVLDVAAAADAEGGATSILCELGGLTVLGQDIGDASCDDGELTGPAVGAVEDALGLVEGVLTALPGVDAADGLRLALLPEASESVTVEDDGTVTAFAQAVLLELSVPSVSIDPSAATDLLDLPALTGDLLALEDGLDELAGLLAGTGLTELLGDVSGLVGQVTGLLGEVGGLLDDLEPPVLSGTIRTPAIDLVLDPVSEASFTAAQDDAPTTPEPRSPTTTQPTPAQPTPTRDLPRTGGAFPVLGLLALAGAAGLRRTG
jgi:hypothetical protein